jgi:hypothetical protein
LIQSERSSFGEIESRSKGLESIVSLRLRRIAQQSQFTINCRALGWELKVVVDDFPQKTWDKYQR